MKLVTDSPEPLPPTPEPTAEAEARLFMRKQPLWTHFLTPGAIVFGAILIAGAIWWTREDDDGDASTGSDLALIGAVSTAEPATTALPAATNLKDMVYAYARQVGLDETKFDQCVNNQDNVARINAEIAAGNALGVTGTPTFFINNKKLVGAQSLALIEEVIQAELKGSPTTLDGYSPALRQLAATTPPNFQIMPSKPDVSSAAIEGKADAKVMVAEFSDFQCPFCKQWNDNSLKQLRTKLGDDLALAFLHFPIVSIHPNAGNASLVAICAQAQDKFWPMHDLLFARQAEWSALK
jgi:protein-disulfide isomerase